MLLRASGLSPPAVVVGVDGGFQLQEVLLHRGPDGSLDYPGKYKETHLRFIRICTR